MKKSLFCFLSILLSVVALKALLPSRSTTAAIVYEAPVSSTFASEQKSEDNVIKGNAFAGFDPTSLTKPERDEAAGSISAAILQMGEDAPR